eukprot:PhF_6_TR38704/c0_g1_i3/m.57917
MEDSSNDIDIHVAPNHKDSTGPSPLEKYQTEYAVTTNNYLLSVPFIIGVLLSIVVITSTSTFAVQKTTSDGTIDHVTINYATELYHAQVNTIEGYFMSVETLMEVPRVVLSSEYATPTGPGYMSIRPMLYNLAYIRNKDINIYYVEVHVVDYEYWDRTGDYRAHSYGFVKDGAEWDGTQPGILTDYNIDNSSVRLNRTFIKSYNYTDLEPVVFLARQVEGIGLQR